MENSNVVSIKTGRAIEIPSGIVKHSIVSLLEDSLIRARRGEIDSILIAYADNDGNTGGVWDGRASYLLLAAARLIRRIHNWIDASNGD
jgi:hypothetical protein